MGYHRTRKPASALPAPVIWTPASIPGLAWWFDSTGGYAENDISVKDPANINNGVFWTVFNGVATPTTYTEGLAGNALYGVSESNATLGLVVAQQPYRLRVAFAPATGVNDRYIIVSTGNGAEQCYVDLQTDTVIFTAGGVSNATCINGVVEYDAVSPGPSNMYLLTWDGGAFALTHVGNGLRNFTIVSADIVFTQRKVTNWYNQASEIPFPSVAQAVNASRPVIADASVLGGVGLTPNGNQSFRWSVAADTKMASAAYVLNQPTTVVTFAKSLGGASYGLADGLAVATRLSYHLAGTHNAFAGINVLGPAVNLAWTMNAVVFNGAASRIRYGALDSGLVNVGAGGATGLIIGARADAATSWDGYIATHIGYYRALSNAELDLLQAYCATL